MRSQQAGGEMIFYDVTNAVRSTHHSGLQRVSAGIRAGLERAIGAGIAGVVWSDGRWKSAAGGPDPTPGRNDWLVEPEVFGPAERPGFAEWLANRGCRAAAIYYDAIPLKFPAITWPQSVARHPHYMKQLARFDRVLAISEASRRELTGYWEWARAAVRARVSVIPLGADADGVPRAIRGQAGGRKRALLMVGIVEPRKNQMLMIDVCEELWNAGLGFELHIVGRLNPHFGAPIADRAAGVSRKHGGLRFHGALGDHAVRELRDSCRAAVFPSIAEGNGLPVLEALWQGLPCVCSKIPALEENASGGGCVLVTPGDHAGWLQAIRAILTDDALFESLRAQALSRQLPTWDVSATAVLTALEED